MSSVVEKSKFLSLVLRHAPETIGLSLDSAGWAQVDALLERANAHGMALNRASLSQIVAGSDKQRFAFSDDGQRIRANQGHSVPVQLALPPQEPPSRLFHGTALRFLASIRRHGLQPMQRQHVHLSTNALTAEAVGRRHGKPCVLWVDAQALHASGQVFLRAENGVWLTTAVAPEFIGFPSDAV